MIGRIAPEKQVERAIAILEAVRRFAAQPGADPSWRPAPLLERLAAEGKSFD